MNTVVYFETNWSNDLIHILTFMEIKINKILFNTKNWVTIALLIRLYLTV